MNCFVTVSMGESIEIDAKFTVDFVKVALEKPITDSGSLFRLVYGTTNYSGRILSFRNFLILAGKSKPVRVSSANNKQITFKEQISFATTFLGVNGKIDSKNTLSISLKEKVCCTLISCLLSHSEGLSNSSRELGKIQVSLPEYIHLDLTKTIVTVKKDFPMKKSHDLPTLEV